MTNDLERVTKLAEELGAEFSYEVTLSKGKEICLIHFLPEELLAFEQAVLAKRDEEVTHLKDEILRMSGITALESINDELLEENESLQAKLAYQNQFLVNCSLGRIYPEEARRFLNATQADVGNWMQGKKAEWEAMLNASKEK